MSQKSQKVESNPQPAASPRQQTAFLKQWKQLVAEGVPRRKDVAEVLRRFRAAAPVSTHVSTNANSEKEERPPNQRIESKMTPADFARWHLNLYPFGFRDNIKTVEYRPNGTSYKAKEVKVGGRRRKSRKNLKKNSGKGGKRRKTRRKRKRKKRRTKRR